MAILLHGGPAHQKELTVDRPYTPDGVGSTTKEGHVFTTFGRSKETRPSSPPIYRHHKEEHEKEGYQHQQTRGVDSTENCMESCSEVN